MANLLSAVADDPVRRRELRKMRGVATAMLVAAAVCFLLASYVQTRSDQAVWGYLRAAAEAGLVGGLADWFAVTALFRRPLGLPIPHTALIPTKKDQLGDSLSSFVHGNFLSEQIVADKVRAARPSARIAEHLDSQPNRARIVAEGAALAREVVGNIDDRQAQELVRNTVFGQLGSWAWGPQLGRLLTAAVDRGNHHGVVEAVLTALHRWLMENRDRVSAIIADRGPVSQGGPIRWIHERVGDKGVDVIIGWVEQLRDDPRDPARVQFDDFLLRLADGMATDPAMIERVEGFKAEVLRHPETQRVVSGIWPSVKELLLASLSDPESDLRRRADDALLTLSQRLTDEPDFAQRVDDRAAAAAGFLVRRYGADAVGLISDTVRRWDASEASRRIELAVGRDLQFIRINGTLVGSIVGLVIHAVSQLIH